MENDGNKYKVFIKCFTFNQADYIEDAMHGFVMQKTDFPYVAAVVDDASKDGEQDVIKRFLENELDMASAVQDETEDYVRVVAKHKTNVNCTFAVLFLKYNHKSIRKAKASYLNEWSEESKYIALCEGDDYWTDPYKLQKQVDFLEAHEDVGLCITDFRFQQGFGELSKPAFAEKGLFKPQSFKEHLINSGYIGPMTWVYRGELYDCCKPEKCVSDGTFAMALNFFALSKVAYLTDSTAVYRSHEGSATGQKDPKKAFVYEKGVFEIQLLYAKKYNINADTTNNLKFQGYASNIISAFEANDLEFVDEALDFYSSHGMEMKWFVEKCKWYVEYHRQYEQILHSKAYRLGKFLLKPFKLFKKK